MSMSLRTLSTVVGLFALVGVIMSQHKPMTPEQIEKFKAWCAAPVTEDFKTHFACMAKNSDVN